MSVNTSPLQTFSDGLCQARLKSSKASALYVYVSCLLFSHRFCSHTVIIPVVLLHHAASLVIFFE